VLGAVALALWGQSSIASDEAQQQDRTGFIAGKAGAYNLRTSAEAEAMAQLGLMIVLYNPAALTAPMRLAIEKAGVKYIDYFPQQIMYDRCSPSLHAVGVCPLDEKQRVVNEIKAHLAKYGQDPNLVGYWVLDDYPGGDVRDLLKQIHAAIMDSNASLHDQRPAICGFGAQFGYSGGPHWGEPAPNEHVFPQGAINFDADACDMIGIYAYGVGAVQNARLIDWSMKQLLPRMLTILRQHGWDPARSPLIGMPQTFAYTDPEYPTPWVLPRSQDVTAQTWAYCRAGAVAILAYSWDDGFKGAKVELYNSKALQNGLNDGVTKCRALWRRNN